MEVADDGMSDDGARRRGAVVRDSHPHELAAGEVTALAKELELVALVKIVEAARDTRYLVVREVTY
jgi:hypothetical protein